MADPTAEMEGLSVDGSEGEMSKAQLKKLKAKQEKEAFKAEKAAKAAALAAEKSAADENDPLKDKYGDVKMVQSHEITGRKWTRVEDLTVDKVGESVLVRARLHNCRSKGKSAFVVLRERVSTVQCTLFVDDQTVSKGMVKYVSDIPKESIVDVEGVLIKPEAAIEGCTQKSVELKVSTSLTIYFVDLKSDTSFGIFQ